MVLRTVCLCLLLTGCIAIEPKQVRQFLTEREAVLYLRNHEKEFRDLAEAWLRSRNAFLYRFGRSSYAWNDYWVSSDWWWWRVRLPYEAKNPDFIIQTVSTWDEAAQIAGTTGGEVSQWLDRMERLGINQLTNVKGTQNGLHFRYIDINYFPVGYFGYGFRYAPSADTTARAVLETWTNQPQRPLHRMQALGDDWFYYEGYWTRDMLPFTPSR